MKKLFLFLIAIPFVSCSDELLDPGEPLPKQNTNILNFKNFEEFGKTYDELSQFKEQDEFESWFLEKNFENSFLQYTYDKVIDTLDFESKADDRELYSEALKAIFNKDFEITVDGSRISLQNGDFINLSTSGNMSDLTSGKNVVGNVKNSLFDEIKLNDLGKNNLDLADRQFNNNSSYTISYQFYGGVGRNCSGTSQGSQRNRRFINTIFSETINIGGTLNQSLYFRSTLQSEFCSFWRCKWENTPGEARRITFINFVVSSNPSAFAATLSPLGFQPSLPPVNGTLNCVTGTYTSNIGFAYLGSYSLNVTFPSNLFFAGTIKSEHLPASGTFISTWNQNANQFN